MYVLQLTAVKIMLTLLLQMRILCALLTFVVSIISHYLLYSASLLTRLITFFMYY